MKTNFLIWISLSPSKNNFKSEFRKILLSSSLQVKSQWSERANLFYRKTKITKANPPLLSKKKIPDGNIRCICMKYTMTHQQWSLGSRWCIGPVPHCHRPHCCGRPPLSHGCSLRIKNQPHNKYEAPSLYGKLTHTHTHTWFDFHPVISSLLLQQLLPWTQA